MSINNVFLVGRLGAAPERRVTQTGKSLCTMSIATDHWDKSQSAKVAEWHRVVVWDQAADNCMKYLDKGSQVAVEGRINTRRYDPPLRAAARARWRTTSRSDRRRWVFDNPRLRPVPPDRAQSVIPCPRRREPAAVVGGPPPVHDRASAAPYGAAWGSVAFAGASAGGAGAGAG
ncbi:MAG: hypothetical protein CVU56_06540 [Deltaproteobacteria bacterium HGW-Deltaproteobacteria-14]|nr:MAG: hypothetical protein CVU56_06540 [Deltaproteobacteria bacterium HGW-Deltaproteobacteria-14]